MQDFLCNRCESPEFYTRKTGQLVCKPCALEKNRIAAQTEHGKQVRRKIRKREGQRLKTQMIFAYGGCCSCCGEKSSEFLTIDHVNGDGKEHRKSVGSKVYRDLKHRGYPKDDFRLLCMNCNFSYGIYGYCPHQKIKE